MGDDKPSTGAGFCSHPQYEGFLSPGGTPSSLEGLFHGKSCEIDGGDTIL